MQQTPDLRSSVRRAAGWLLFLRIGTRASSFAALILVSRWIGPSEVGVFAAGMVVISSLETLSTPGLEAALIQRPTLRRPEVNVVWSIRVARGFLAAGLLFASSSWLASLLDAPDAAGVLRVLALMPIFNGFLNTYIVQLRRDLDFRTEAGLHLGPAILRLIVSLAWAVVSPTAAALVAGVLCEAITKAAASHLVLARRPRITRRWRDGRELYAFSRWMWASSILVFLITQGDDVVVGAMLGATALGIYQIAYRVSNTATTEVAHVVNQLAFPLLSRYHDDHERFQMLFLRSLTVTSAVVLPVTVATGLLADPLVAVLLGAEWEPAVPVIRVLAIWGAVRALGAVTSPALQALGRPDAVAKYQFMQLVGIAVLIYPAIQAWGAVGAAVAVAVPTALTHPLRYPVISKIVQIPPVRIAGAFLVPVTAALPMAAAIVLVLRGFGPALATTVLGLVTGGTTGLITYLVSGWLLDRAAGGHVKAALEALVLTRQRGSG